MGLALRTLLATVDETLPQLPASTHREVCLASAVLYAERQLDTGKLELLWFFPPTDRDGAETAQLGPCGTDRQDEVGPTVCDDKVHAVLLEELGTLFNLIYSYFLTTPWTS